MLSPSHYFSPTLVRTLSITTLDARSTRAHSGSRRAQCATGAPASLPQGNCRERRREEECWGFTSHGCNDIDGVVCVHWNRISREYLVSNGRYGREETGGRRNNAIWQIDVYLASSHHINQRSCSRSAENSDETDLAVNDDYAGSRGVSRNAERYGPCVRTGLVILSNITVIFNKTFSLQIWSPALN